MARDDLHISITAGAGEARQMGGERVAAWFADALVRDQLAELAAALRRAATLSDLTRAPAWAAQGAALRSLLGTIQHGRPDREAPVRAGHPLRAVAWNILKGIAFEEIVAALASHPDLADANLLLSEVDVGMVRSGNRHVAAELAAQLGRHWAYLPNYFELTKGPGAEGRLPGRNAIGLHGVAILSRHRPRALAACPLPECFDAFDFAEKRFGGRAGLLAELPGPWVVGVVHLEVRNSPACRGRQMRAFLSGLDRFCTDRRLPADVPVLLAGDLNSHTFARGTLWRAARGAVRLLATSRRALERQLLEPWRGGREPLFAELTRAGFDWRALNDRAPTATERLGRVEDWELLPPAWRERIAAVLGLSGREVPLRLDWFCGRGLAAGQITQARTVLGLCRDGRPSDHAPIRLELAAAQVGAAGRGREA